MRVQVKTVWEVVTLALMAVVVILQIPAFNVANWTPSDTGSILSGAGAVIQAIAIVYAAYVGANTFDQWRRQKLEERRIEVAERALAIGYRVQETFAAIRSPFLPAAELQEVGDDLKKRGVIDFNTADGEVRRLVTSQSVLNRVQRHEDLWIELWELISASKAVLGPRVEAPLRELLALRSKLTSAAQMYARNGMRDFEDVFWSGHKIEGDKVVDPFAGDVDKVVRELEGQLHPLMNVS